MNLENTSTILVGQIELVCTTIPVFRRSNRSPLIKEFHVDKVSQVLNSRLSEKVLPLMLKLTTTFFFALQYPSLICN